MHARLSVAGLVIVVGLCISIPTAAGAVGAAQTGSAQKHVSADQCKQGGWQNLTDGQGQPFRNQGQCISYFTHNPVSLADLAGSFSGTTSFTVGTGGCFIEQVFDATYPGSSAVGSVTLHLDGCVTPLMIPPERFTYAGTFTFATSVGTIAGNASGAIYNAASSPPPLPDDFELTLSVLSGTGAFGGTTGTIHVSMQWPPPFGSPVTGSVTVP